MRRKIGAALIACTILTMSSTAIGANNDVTPEVKPIIVYANEIQPRFAYIGFMSAGLSITSGKATVTGDVTLLSESHSVDLLVELQYKSGSNWKTLTSWSDHGEGTFGAILSKYYYVSSGYTYRTATSVTVYNSNDRVIETVTKYSDEVSY